MACLIETYSRVRTTEKAYFFPFVGKLPSGCIQKRLGSNKSARLIWTQAFSCSI